ncbi:MAG: discoidin domain-containing protein [Terracidiphilus sp.]
MNWTRREFCQAGAVSVAALGLPAARAETQTAPSILDPEKQLTRWTFWTNRDWDWYGANLPMWESPHRQIDEIYYYRAEVLTKHLRYASPETGYIFTEFSNADRLEWAGRYNAIASAADLHFEEIRWLKTRQYAQDYARYWMLTDGAQPRNYGFAAAWSAWQMGLVHGDHDVASSLLDKYVDNYEVWERGWVEYPHDNGYDPERQLFWNTGRDMGGEFNLASCQLSEQLRGIEGYKIRGGAGYRPDINAVLYAEAQTIGWLAALAGRTELADRFAQKAALLRRNTQRDLWDDERQFFVHRWRYDEYSEGDSQEQKSIRAWSRIWETNSDRNGGVGYQPQLHGAGHGRELTGYVPWRYGLPADEERFAAAWKFLLSLECFDAPFGPATAERVDPWFHVIYHACRHNGQSWPFHTARILSAAARLLNDYDHRGEVTREHYFMLLERYARTQYKEGKPHLAEAHHPDKDEWVQDEWPGLDYFHSSYIDHVITGLAGLRPADEATITINPLAPADWEYFALDGVAYRNHKISIVWDKQGSRYGIGRGLLLLIDGQVAARSPQLGKLTAPLPKRQADAQPYEVIVSANADGAKFPKAEASFTAKYDSPAAALDGLCWYDSEYGDKWTSRGSWASEDWFQIDFDKPQTIGAVRLFLYADERGVEAPESYAVHYDVNGTWSAAHPTSVHPRRPAACRVNTITIAPITTQKVRIIFRHAPGIGVGLAQVQVLAPQF